MKTLTKISIPDDMKFSDLKLARDSDGMVSFDMDVIGRICDASGIDRDLMFNAPEDNVAGLIVKWYNQHVLDGGERDTIADDLIAEISVEDQMGSGISHKPGTA